MIDYLSKIFVFIGLIFLLIGLTLIFFSRLNIPIGKLPGDIFVQKKNFFFYFPITTSIIVSFVLTILFYLISIFINKR